VISATSVANQDILHVTVGLEALLVVLSPQAGVVVELVAVAPEVVGVDMVVVDMVAVDMAAAGVVCMNQLANSLRNSFSKSTVSV
jgi:hypothetical protein